MNVYHAMGFAGIYIGQQADGIAAMAQRVLTETAKAYDAIAPTPEMWAQYPWAKWYAIDANGSAGLFGQEPEVEGLVWVIEWTEDSELPVEAMTVELPDHIDWRDCKWSRPEVTK